MDGKIYRINEEVQLEEGNNCRGKYKGTRKKEISVF